MLRQFTEAARKACEWATLWGRGELSAEVSQPARVEFELLEPRLLLDGYAALERPTELQYWDPTTADNGYNFFGVTGTSYLLDMEGKVVHTWPVGTNPHLLPNSGNRGDARRAAQGHGGCGGRACGQQAELHLHLNR